MKYKFFYGLWGISSDDVLISPNAEYNIKLPKFLGYRICNFLNKFAYTGFYKDILVYGTYTKHNLFFNPICYNFGYYSTTHLILFGKSVKILKTSKECYYIDINIKCELKKRKK